jgi:hypothetical protein
MTKDNTSETEKVVERKTVTLANCPDWPICECAGTCRREAQGETVVADVGRRLGTPISQLSGRPGHPGYEQFKKIAQSWGYD